MRRQKLADQAALDKWLNEARPRPNCELGIAIRGIEPEYLHMPTTDGASGQEEDQPTPSQPEKTVIVGGW